MSKKNSKGKLRVRLTDYLIPQVRLDSSYKEILVQSNQDKSTQQFLKHHFNEGNQLIYAIEQRQKTLLKISNALLQRQQDFFLKGFSYLKPLNMQVVADLIGVHTTTVSRAVSNKYIRTDYGILELRKFFSSGYKSEDGQKLAASSIHEMIKIFIEKEDPSHPLSDRKLVSKLKESGITIARRTVTKYREKIGILPAYLRKLN